MRVAAAGSPAAIDVRAMLYSLNDHDSGLVIHSIDDAKMTDTRSKTAGEFEPKRLPDTVRCIP
jgi:hypothetical protein